MSATASVPAPQPIPTGGRHRPTLRLVRSPRRVAPRLPFVAVVVALLSIGLVGLLLLSMQRGQASFRQGALSTTNGSLADQVQQLRRTVERDQDPGVLADRAKALGMVPETDPGYLDAAGGVIGAVPSGDPVPTAGAARTDGVVVAGRAVTAPTAPAAPAVEASPRPRAAATTSAGKAMPTPTPAAAKAVPTPTAAAAKAAPTPTTTPRSTR